MSPSSCLITNSARFCCLVVSSFSFAASESTHHIPSIPCTHDRQKSNRSYDYVHIHGNNKQTKQNKTKQRTKNKEQRLLITR